MEDAPGVVAAPVQPADRVEATDRLVEWQLISDGEQGLLAVGLTLVVELVAHPFHGMRVDASAAREIEHGSVGDHLDVHLQAETVGCHRDHLPDRRERRLVTDDEQPASTAGVLVSGTRPRDGRSRAGRGRLGPTRHRPTRVAHHLDVASPPAGLMLQICAEPLRVEMNARVLPSGDQAGPRS